MAAPKNHTPPGLSSAFEEQLDIMKSLGQEAFYAGSEAEGERNVPDHPDPLRKPLAQERQERGDFAPYIKGCMKIQTGTGT